MCTTRRLIKEGHNITELGYPKDTDKGCRPCNDDIVCSYISPKCGCNQPDCVDLTNYPDIGDLI